MSTIERATTPIPKSGSGPSNSAPPSTPSANTIPSNTAMRVQRNAPVPSTPSGHHRRLSSIPRTPSTSALVCSSSASAFARVTVHTAKCSECDFRNKGTMLRCPGCTFQICKPCQDRREKVGRSLAHGNMLSPQVVTPGTGSSVVRRRPVATVKREREKDMEREKYKGEDTTNDVCAEGGALECKEELQETKGKKRMMEPGPRPKLKFKSKAKGATSSDDSSDDDYAPDPASPTPNKRRCTELTSRTDISDMPSPLLKPADKIRDSTRLSPGGSMLTEKPLSDMTTNELLAHYGVNTPTNPYKAHLLSRDEPVVSNPVIEIPEAVKRGFKPRPTAEEMQKNIQDRVREKMGLPKSTAAADGRA